MSVRFRNSVRLATATNSVILANQDRATVAFLLQINGTISNASYTGAYFLLKTSLNGVYVRPLSVDDTEQSMRVQIGWRVTNEDGLSYTATMYPNVVYGVVMTYDKDVSGDQAVWINGIKYAIAPIRNLPLDDEAAAFEMGLVSGSGPYTRDFNLGRVMVWNGFVAQSSDIENIISGVSDPTNLGLSATWRDMWTLDGPPATTPTGGDTALNGVITNDYPVTPTIGVVSGSSLTYENPLVYVPQTTYGAPIVLTSGKSIKVEPKTPAGVALKVAALGATMPTARINGGSPFTMEYKYADQHTAVIYYFPDGKQAGPNDTVTFSAVSGFISTPLGTAPGCTDMACVNKAGGPVYVGEPHNLVTGFNYDYPGCAYYGPSNGPRNWWPRLQLDTTKETPSTIRDDGTLKVGRVNIWLSTTASTTGVDGDYLGFPMPFGKWVLSYVPLDAGRETNISITTDTPGCANELMDYRNDGVNPGDRVTKVFEIVPNVEYPNSLVGSMNDSQTTVPMENTTSISGTAMDGRAVSWLKIDNEYMRVTAVNTTTKVATVVRGQFNSTPTSHANGTAFISSFYVQNPGLKINITGPSNVPNYAPDVVVYSPPDWTPPDPPAPVTDLDTSFLYRTGAGKAHADSMVNAGVCRYMGSTGAFTQMAEPEQMRRSTDQFWGYDQKFVSDFRITDLKPFDPIETPYAYSHQANFPGSETYSATLSAPINTTPASETPGSRTVETITISDAATAPVFAGSRLFIGSEQMRVVSATGTSVQVVRGTMGTSTSTHAAGPITVGWRVPITSTDQYEKISTVAIDLTTDVPHRLRNGMWGSDPASLDLNPLARMTVTLTEDLNAGSTTASISTSPGNWHYIRNGLYVQFESDVMRLLDADSVAGTITFEQSPKSAHAAGTVGNTFCTGAFCHAKEDPTLFAWSPNQPAGFFPIVTGPNRLLVGAYINTPSNIMVVDSDQQWDQTPLGSGTSDASQLHYRYPISIYPFDYCARQSALSPGCYHWVNIPVLASDDMVRDIAIQVYSNLPNGAGHKVIVEHGNELWHPLFPFLHLNPWISSLAGFGGGWGDQRYDWAVFRSKQETDIFNSVRVEMGHDATALHCLASQTGAIDRQILRGELLGIYCDVASTAPYSTPPYNTAIKDAFNAADDEQAMDLWTFDQSHNAASGAMYKVLVDSKKLNQYRNRTGREILDIKYEGGTSSMLPIPPNGTNDTSIYPHGVERNLDLNYNPQTRHAITDMLYMAQQRGVNGLCFFEYAHWPHGIDVGTGKYFEMWGFVHYQGQPAGKGDGTDGKSNNLLCRMQPGLPGTKAPLTNYGANNVAVKLQAVLDWNYAHNNPEPPEHNPLPRGIYAPIVRRRRFRPPSIYRIPKEHAVIPPPVITRPRSYPITPRPHRRPTRPTMFRIAQEHIQPQPPAPPNTNAGRRVIVFRNIVS